MPLVGASPVYRPPVAGEPLRLREDGHWSTEGLVGYWPMREMRGETVQDVSGFENHGTFVGGAPYWIGSRWGPALKFQTVMDEMQVASDPLRGATTFTVAAWLRYDGFADVWQRCWGRWQDADDEKGWGFWRTYTSEVNVERDKWNFIWSQNGRYDASLALAGPANIVAGQWYALAVTYDSATMRLYIDGVEVASKNWSGALSTVDVPITTGAYSNRYFNGRVYSQYIAGRALSAAEIRALYAAPDLPIWRPRAGISLIGLPALWLLDGDAQTTGAADAQATRIMLPHADAGARGDAEAQAARTFGTRGDAQATGAADAQATRIMLPHADAGARGDAEAQAARTFGTRGDAQATGAADAQATRIMLPHADAGARGDAEGTVTYSTAVEPNVVSISDAAAVTDTIRLRHRITVRDSLAAADDVTHLRHRITVRDPLAAVGDVTHLRHRMTILDPLAAAGDVTQLLKPADADIRLTDAAAVSDRVRLRHRMTIAESVKPKEMCRSTSPCWGGYFERRSGDCAATYNEDDDQDSNLYRELVDE